MVDVTHWDRGSQVNEKNRKEMDVEVSSDRRDTKIK